MEEDEVIQEIAKFDNLTKLIEHHDFWPQVMSKLMELIERKNVDTSHFTYIHNGNHISTYMTKNSNVNQELLREYIVTKKLIEYGCCMCGLDTWMDKPIYLYLVHINNKVKDNRLENLEFICPNCKSCCKKKRK